MSEAIVEFTPRPGSTNDLALRQLRANGRMLRDALAIAIDKDPEEVRGLLTFPISLGAIKCGGEGASMWFEAGQRFVVMPPAPPPIPPRGKRKHKAKEEVAEETLADLPDELVQELSAPAQAVVADLRSRGLAAEPARPEPKPMRKITDEHARANDLGKTVCPVASAIVPPAGASTEPPNPVCAGVAPGPRHQLCTVDPAPDAEKSLAPLTPTVALQMGPADPADKLVIPTFLNKRVIRREGDGWRPERHALRGEGISNGAGRDRRLRVGIWSDFELEVIDVETGQPAPPPYRRSEFKQIVKALDAVYLGPLREEATA